MPRSTGSLVVALLIAAANSVALAGNAMPYRYVEDDFSWADRAASFFPRYHFDVPTSCLRWVNDGNIDSPDAILATSTFNITTGTPSWNVAANWTPNGVPNSIGVDVTFNAPTGSENVALNAAITIGSLTVTNNSTNTWQLSNGTGSLTLDVASGNASFTVNGTGNVVNTLSASTTLNDTASFTVNNTATASSSGALTMTGSMSGSGGVIKDGAGRMSYTTATKTYTGATTINAGVVRLTNAGKPTGTSAITVNSGGQLLLDTSGPQAWGTLGTAGAVITLNGAGPSSTGALRNDGTGTVSLANNISLASDASVFENSAAGTLQLDGIISGSGGLIKVGSGTLLLTNANTFSGSFTSSAGATDLAINNALGSVASITIGNGTTVETSVSGLTNTINDAAGVSINGTGILDLSGGSETIGSLTSTSSTASVITGDNGGAGSLTVGDSTSTTFAGIISGTRATTGAIFTKQGSGTLTLSAANNYTGQTVINNGTLSLDNTGGNTPRLVNTTNITMNSGGTLLLAGTNASTNRLNNSATMTLAGGTFNLGGLSEGAAGTTGVGALTLTATSAIDFGTSGTNNLIQFAGLGTHTATTILQILNWEGTPGSANGNDRLLFAGTLTDFTTLFAQNDVPLMEQAATGRQISAASTKSMASLQFPSRAHG